MSLSSKVAAVLRTIGTSKCWEKADSLEKTAGHTLYLHNLGLHADHAQRIGHSLVDENSLRSISLSYNSALGDTGVMNILQKLPKSIEELGLVGCGISDKGGKVVLEWVRDSPNTRVVCIEQNHFSSALRRVFQQLSDSRPQLMIVI